VGEKNLMINSWRTTFGDPLLHAEHRADTSVCRHPVALEQLSFPISRIKEATVRGELNRCWAGDIASINIEWNAVDLLPIESPDKLIPF